MAYIKMQDVMKICEGYSKHCFNSNDARGQAIADRILDDVVELPTANENLTDKILANYIIVSPCKVGDTVYFNHAKLNETCSAKVIKITINFYTPSMPLWITIEYESKLIGRQEVEMGSDVFELFCFPTKEEAEKALTGGAL